MTVSNSTRSALLALALISLAGCGSFSGMLGLERHVPDETQVVVRPPLTLPPDYDLMPPGTTTAVGAEHEGAQSMSDAGLGTAAPKKEEKGFFGRMFSGEMFGLGSDSDTEAAKPAPAAVAAPNATATPPADQQAAPPPNDAAGMAPVPPKPEERGFFGRLFHGDIFGSDSDTAAPKAPAGSDAAPAAPDQSSKPSGSAAPTTP